jgi:hypothetical protein
VAVRLLRFDPADCGSPSPPAAACLFCNSLLSAAAMCPHGRVNVEMAYHAQAEQSHKSPVVFDFTSYCPPRGPNNDPPARPLEPRRTQRSAIPALHNRALIGFLRPHPPLSGKNGRPRLQVWILPANQTSNWVFRLPRPIRTS